MDNQELGPVRKFFLANLLEFLGLVFLLGGLYYAFDDLQTAVAENSIRIEDTKTEDSMVRERLAVISNNQMNFKEDIDDIKKAQETQVAVLNDILRELRKQ